MLFISYLALKAGIYVCEIVSHVNILGQKYWATYTLHPTGAGPSQKPMP